MKRGLGIVWGGAIITFLFLSSPCHCAGENSNRLDKIYLKNGTIFQGIWDPSSSLLHLIDKNNQPAGDITIKSNNIARIERNSVPSGSGVSTSALELKMNGVEKAEASLKDQLKVLATLKKQLTISEKSRAELHKLFAGKPVNSQIAPAVYKRYKDADVSVANYTLAVSTTKTRCTDLYKVYQSLGGKTVYAECQ